VNRPRAADDFATIRARMEEPRETRVPRVTQRVPPDAPIAYPSTSGVTSVATHSPLDALCNGLAATIED
jgi:hypothetical protein